MNAALFLLLMRGAQGVVVTPTAPITIVCGYYIPGAVASGGYAPGAVKAEGYAPGAVKMQGKQA